MSTLYVSHETEKNKDSGVLRLVSILHYAAGGFFLLLVLFFGVLAAWNTTFTPSVPVSALAPALTGRMFILGLTFALAVPLMLVCFSGELIRQRTGRVISIVASVLFLPFFPVGTIISIFSLWVLTAPQTKLEYGESLTPRAL